MPSTLLKLADLGFTAHGCYRDGDCERCAAKSSLTWFWHNRWSATGVFSTVCFLRRGPMTS
jgi:hypothetical protein